MYCWEMCLCEDALVVCVVFLCVYDNSVHSVWVQLLVVVCSRLMCCDACVYVKRNVLYKKKKKRNLWLN